MKEDFLHYLWKLRKFPGAGLKTSNGEPITIINPGQYLQLAGPDFFNAQLVIGSQKWAGNIEVHLKSSDWYLHHHENDPAYENVILHVVWENDMTVFRKNNSEIPVLELKHFTSQEIIENYNSLTIPKSWIYCEKALPSIDDFVLRNWMERLFFERVERKAKPVDELLVLTNSDWEAVLFCMLAKNFGLNTNGPAFFKMARAIPFSLIQKESFELQNLEALLFGTIGLLNSEKEDVYFLDLKFRFHYLRHKYQLEPDILLQVEFFKHRPDNFPTIRLSQFANLYHKRKNLFSEIITADSAQSIYEIFDISVSDYWLTHYLFDCESPKKRKLLTKSFIDLLIINTIIPIRFEYARSQGKEISEAMFSILETIDPEENAIISKFRFFGVEAKNALESQALLQLKNEYCSHSKCMECAIGMELLKGGIKPVTL
jgi:hypothetical protein